MIHLTSKGHLFIADKIEHFLSDQIQALHQPR